MWSDVDLDHGALTVSRNLVRVHNQVPQFGEPKSQTRRRSIALPAKVIPALKTHKARQVRDRLAAEDWASYDLVFCSRIGTPLMRRNVLRQFKVALAHAGLPDVIRFHDLRHTHATRVLRAGVPIKTASVRLGHSASA